VLSSGSEFVADETRTWNLEPELRTEPEHDPPPRKALRRDPPSSLAQAGPRS